MTANHDLSNKSLLEYSTTKVFELNINDLDKLISSLEDIETQLIKNEI